MGLVGYQWGPGGSIADYGCHEDMTQYVNGYIKGMVLVDVGGGKHWSIRADRIKNFYGINGFQPFPRNLVSDFSPALIVDPHPYLSATVEPHGSHVAFQDGFGSNSWCSTSVLGGLDNPYVYYVRNQVDVTSGVLNPPGTWQLVSGYLDPWAPRAQFGPFSGGGGSSYTVNSWGFGDAQGVDMVPDTTLMTPLGPAVGWRVNCQLAGNGSSPESNLQTFLGVNWVSPVLGSKTLPRIKPLSGAYRSPGKTLTDPMKVLEIIRSKNR